MEHDCCIQEKNSHNTEENRDQDTKQPSKVFLLIGTLLIGAVLVQAFNFTQINQANGLLEKQSAAVSLAGSNVQNAGAPDMSGWTDNEKMNYEMHGVIPARAQVSATASSPGINTAPSTANFSEVSPKGVPIIYGSELGVDFDDVSPNNQQKANETIAVLSAFDQEKSGKFIELQGEKFQRYIKITSQISCEYCCGAESIIFPDGKRACGCAHSYSMRGLAKYLLDKHADEFTDDQILEELGKWKTLYFPGALAQKAQALKDKGIEFSYINLASNKYRGLENGEPQGGSMVGGC
ncbi:MAG TPA: hypothetical protein HA254_01200 [Candidatus Diapherotrites archaeon]|uniref:Uncharacterized protein n=1 Tax=Candidatus Iainarchaeum sp. TaxID=3101447 RepID=A0A7J4IY99_9ARCH|nr:hypothetical protein [Candidatus Diapherotrites archaeon]